MFVFLQSTMVAFIVETHTKDTSAASVTRTHTSTRVRYQFWFGVACTSQRESAKTVNHIILVTISHHHHHHHTTATTTTTTILTPRLTAGRSTFSPLAPCTGWGRTPCTCPLTRPCTPIWRKRRLDRCRTASRQLWWCWEQY